MRCSKSHVSTVSDSRRIGFVSHIRSVTQSVRTFIWKWSDQIFESRQHRPTCACCFGNDVTVCHCLRQWSGLQIHHLTLGTITLPSRGADGLLQRDCPLLFLHVVFQPALLTAAWFLLSLSDALPVSLDLASPRCVPLRATQNTLWNPIRAARAGLDWDLAFFRKKDTDCISDPLQT